MSIIVFAGPSLPAAVPAAMPALRLLPPASQGDIYRACLDQPEAIGLIDGYFEAVPSVWHKEILWALSHDIPVYGGASMGALRAAELAGFGMTGVGRIFEAFRSGELEDDDEVAVLHGPAELGYPPLSDAMVNIRYTLLAAVRAGVVDEDAGQQLVAIAKGMFYQDRHYPALFRLAAEAGLPEALLARLAQWTAGHGIDQKRLDAIATLHALHVLLGDGARPRVMLPPGFAFEHTLLWEKLMRTAGDRAGDRP